MPVLPPPDLPTNLPPEEPPPVSAYWKPKSWHYHACQMALAAANLGWDQDDEALRRIARACGKPQKLVRTFLKSPWAQEQFRQFHGRVVEHMARKRADPLLRLMDQGERAAEVLIQAMELAVQAENVEQMRQTAVALLAHIGRGPVKRTESRHEHLVQQIDDPVVLRQIIETGEVPQLPPPMQ
jgi:hypothetical protein